MKIIAANQISSCAGSENGTGNAITLANDVDPRELDLKGVNRIDLQFPKFTDGRAFSQAFLLRRRQGFRGNIRATGDVLVDQLVQMARTGFSEAVLRADQRVSVGQKLLIEQSGYTAFYQGDVLTPKPRYFGDTKGESV